MPPSFFLAFDAEPGDPVVYLSKNMNDAVSDAIGKVAGTDEWKGPAPASQPRLERNDVTTLIRPISEWEPDYSVDAIEDRRLDRGPDWRYYARVLGEHDAEKVRWLMGAFPFNSAYRVVRRNGNEVTIFEGKYFYP